VNNGGRVGRVRGIEESEGDSSPENDGVMGDSVGVLRRTYDDMGVLAASSVVESWALMKSMVSTRFRNNRGDDEGRGEEDCA
jgi:hypothetical protein